MDGQNEEGRRPYQKLTPEERARFLEVLRETGNRRFAAEAIGVEPRLMDQRREHDPELDREWEAAAEEAHRRLSGAEGPFDFAQDRPFDPSILRPRSGQASLGTVRAPGGGLALIRRGKKGRLQLVAGGEGRWNAEVEERFKAALRESGNVRAAARAVGFSEGTIWQRRRQWPAFARMLEEMLEEAELALEFRIASMGSNVVGEAPPSLRGASATRQSSGPELDCFAPLAMTEDDAITDETDAPRNDEGAGAGELRLSTLRHRSGEPSLGTNEASDKPSPGPSPKGRGEEVAPLRFDPDFAMRFLKWREEKRRGRGRWAPRAKPPSIEAVTETIVRRVEAIKRHRRREAEE